MPPKAQEPSILDYIDHVQVNLHLNVKALGFIRPLAQRIVENDLAQRTADFNVHRRRLRATDLLSHEDWFRTAQAQELHKALLKKYKDLTVEYYRDKERAYVDYTNRFKAHTSRMGRPIDMPPTPMSLNTAMGRALAYICEHGTLPALPEALPRVAPVTSEEAEQCRSPGGQMALLYPSQG